MISQTVVTRQRAGLTPSVALLALPSSEVVSMILREDAER